MKKFTTLIMGLAAVLALTACNSKGTEVKAEEFKEKAAAVEEHQYSEVTIKWSSKGKSTMPDMEKLIMSGEVEMKTEEDSIEGEAKFTFSNGQWTTDSKAEGVNEFAEMVGLTLKDANFDASEMSEEYEQMAEQYGIDAKVKYYTNPLGCEVSAKGSYEDAKNGSGKVNIYSYVGFDKYGYITKYEAKVDISGTVKVSEKVSYSSSMVITENITLSYK